MASGFPPSWGRLLPKTDMNACIIVADGARARFFGLQRGEERERRSRLAPLGSLENPDFRGRGAEAPQRIKTEHITDRQAGATHPVNDRRDQHRLELERRFAAEIAQRAAGLTSDWAAGTVILIADPRMLGLLREEVRGVLKPGLQLKELAKDYTALTTQELERHLIVSGVLPNGSAAG